MSSKDLRRQSILDAAFDLFVEKTIEVTTFDDIAQRAGVGVATVYRHFENKQNLAIEVCSSQWEKRLSYLDSERPVENISDISAIERFKYSVEVYVDLFMHDKDLLIFSNNFNHYINHCKKEMEIELGEYWTVFEKINTRFHLMYEKAKEDGTLRTDIPEAEFMRIAFHTIMATCFYYVSGFIWGADSDENNDYSEEIRHVSNMIINYFAK